MGLVNFSWGLNLDPQLSGSQQTPTSGSSKLEHVDSDIKECSAQLSGAQPVWMAPKQVTELMEGRPYDVFKISLRILVFVEIALEHMNMYMCIYKFYYSRITSIEIINWNPLELKFKLSNSWIFGTILQTDLYSETVHHQFIDLEDPKFIWWLKNGSFLGEKSQAFREDEFGPHLP